MNDQPNGGGTANTPPFPRLVREDTDAGPNPAPGGPPSREPHEPPAEQPMSFAEAPARSDRTTRRGAQGAPPETPAAAGRRVFPPRPAADIRRRAEIGLSRGFERIADRLEEAAERLERLAEDRLEGPGPRARASDLAYSAAGWMGEASDYLRTSELDVLRADLERQVRERPVRSLLLAAGAGWLLGKILR